MDSHNTYIAKTFAGLEPLLIQELTDLGAQNIQLLTRAVMFEGDLALLYRANLCLRTALRIVQPLLVSENIRTADELYDFARSINWLRCFETERTFSVHSVAERTDEFNNTMMVSLKVKDAIADQFRQYKGERPSVDKDNPDVRIDVHLQRNRCTISLDTSGEALYKRGYRQGGHPAPANETLAAALVKFSGWTADKVLLDPFCGSGTILTEAALIASQTPPNLNRRRFGFQMLRNYDPVLLADIKKELAAQIINSEDLDLMIIGNDIAPASIREARANAAAAEMDEHLRLSIADFFEREPPRTPGILITNLPYGERISSGEDIASLYKRIGDRLKNTYKGWTAYLLSGNPEAFKRIGLKSSQKYHLYNGAIACTFAKFELY